MKPEPYMWRRPEKSYGAGRPSEERAIWAEERGRYGYDERELWSLYGTIARFIVPRLERFRDESPHENLPHGLSVEEWKQELSLMIDAFVMLELCEDAYTPPRDGESELEKGMELFLRRIHYLWR
jgi:hypothetical protein